MLERVRWRRISLGSITGVAALAFLALAAELAGHSEPPSDVVRVAITRDADSLDAALTVLGSTLRAASATPAGESAVRTSFRRARAAYKHVEAVVEFYAPALAAAFNSRRQEVDDDDAPPPSTLAAQGFPALEALLWPRLAPANRDSAVRIVFRMHPLVGRLRGVVPDLVPTSAQLLELARLELARVSTLGIAGFDSPASGDAMIEAASALEGVRRVFAEAGPGYWSGLMPARRVLDSSLARAAAYLRGHPDFVDFNRLAFITSFAEPATRALDALRRQAAVPPVRIPRAWRAASASVFEPNAFDARVYAPATAPRPTADLIDLGRQLFSDPRLSGLGTRSCASCHNPATAFQDGLPRAANIRPGGPPVARNTPTLINAALEPSQFMDERSVTLEDQVLEVLRSPAEMAGSVELAAETLSRDASTRARFARAFQDAHGSTASSVTPLRVRQALAAYVRSLVALDSRFDRAVEPGGDTTVLTNDERRGFTLFMGKARCGTCHFAPLFNGTSPPMYLSSDVEVIGTSVSSATPAVLDPDSGRARIDHVPIHVSAFKTPTMRNVTLTAPYMHNGAFRSLDDVLVFYDNGGGVGAGAHVPTQTLSPDSLRLSKAERAQIIAFLGALADTAGFASGGIRPR
jgi:cytochrome c peroxidase